MLPSFFLVDCQFRVNEFGALEVITDESEMDSVKKATATTTWMVPTAQEGKAGPPTADVFLPSDLKLVCPSFFTRGPNFESPRLLLCLVSLRKFL